MGPIMLYRALCCYLFISLLSACNSSSSNSNSNTTGSPAATPTSADNLPGSGSNNTPPESSTPANPGNVDSGNNDTDGDSTDTTTVVSNDDDQDGPMLDDECSIAAQNQWVDDAMRDFYIYADQVPIVNLADFESPESLIRGLRVAPDRFSNVANQSTQIQLFDEGIQFGYGSNVRRDANGEWRIFFVLEGSPSQVAGLKRGDILVAVNGIPFDDITREQSIEIFGTGIEIRSPLYTLRDEDGMQRDVIVTRGEFPFVTVQAATVIEAGGNTIGYMYFAGFTETARDELDSAINMFISAEIDELVLDLRYNGGGRTAIAHKLASQIAGQVVFGQVMEQSLFNDAYQANNFTLFFPNEVIALALPRVIALVGPGTASASELTLNILEPYIDVTVIGALTVGKPFASRGRDRCGKRLNAMELISLNAAGNSVANGIMPDCAASDDFRLGLGDPVEALLAAAIDFIVDGVCMSNTNLALRTRQSTITGLPAEPMQLHQLSIAE